MYRLLIIDDEALICSGLKSMIEKLHIPEIGEIALAMNKSDARRISEELKPDIVISDIQLNDGTGLELIRELSAVCSRTRFIVLSGYDNFDYAKEAIKLGVMHYLLKPASTEELEEVLNTAIASLKKQRVLEEGSSVLYKKMMLENNLNKIFIAGQLPQEKIEELLDEMQLFFPHPCFYVSVIALGVNVFPGKEAEETEVLIDRARDSHFTRAGVLVMGFYSYSRDLVLLFNCPNPVPQDDLCRFMHTVNQTLAPAAKCGFLSAISALGRGAASVHSLYQQCQKALCYKILYQLYDVIPFSEISDKSDKSISSDNEMSKLAGYMNSFRGNSKDISDFIDRIINSETLVNYSIESISQLYHQIMQIIGITAVDDKLICSNNTYKDFSSFNSLAELRIYLKEMVYDIHEQMKTVQKERTIVDIAKRYVRENYRKDINLTVVANIVSMNYSYFSKLFKNQTGMNFSDYVLKVRMEEAKKLLADPMNRIHEIAARVGYENPKHFTRAFKSYLGMTPSQYQMKN